MSAHRSVMLTDCLLTDDSSCHSGIRIASSSLQLPLPVMLNTVQPPYSCAEGTRL